MKVNYKRIGDSFTLDEYNALVYLLKQDEWIEVIKLSKNGYDGKYANYTLYDPKNALVKKPYGFDIVKPLETVYLKVKSKFNCSFMCHTIVEPLYQDKNKNIYNSKFDLVENKGQTISNKDKVKFERELINEHKFYFINSLEHYDDETGYLRANEKLSIVNVDDNLECSIPLKLDDKKDMVLDFNCVMQLMYLTPEINIIDGNPPLDNEIICESFKDIQQAIKSTPNGGCVNLKLLGKEYLMTDEIYIKNKTVNIRGGNKDNLGNNYTVLNAQKLCRHFNIHSGSKVTISNIKLINGYAMGNISRESLHNRGGSVYLTSGYKPVGGDYTHLVTFFTANGCQFIDNIADRGGAIYNRNAKLECNDCVFTKNTCKYETDHNYSDASKSTLEWRKWNWGGAIRSESVKGYYFNECFDQIHILKSPIVQAVRESDSQGTIYETNIKLIFMDTQNVNVLNKYNLTKDNFKFYNYSRKREMNIKHVGEKKRDDKGHIFYDIEIADDLITGDRCYFKITLKDKDGNNEYSITTTPLIIIADDDKKRYLRSWTGESVILAVENSPYKINRAPDYETSGSATTTVHLRLTPTANETFMTEIKENIHELRCVEFNGGYRVGINKIGERQSLEFITDPNSNKKIPIYSYDIELDEALKEGYEYYFRILTKREDPKTKDIWYDERITRPMLVTKDKKGKDVLIPRDKR